MLILPEEPSGFGIPAIVYAIEVIGSLIRVNGGRFRGVRCLLEVAIMINNYLREIFHMYDITPYIRSCPSAPTHVHTSVLHCMSASRYQCKSKFLIL